MKNIKTQNALKICYYLMAADGLMVDDERSKFDELGNLMDDQYPSYRETLLWECRQKGFFSEDRERVFLLMDYVDRELEEGVSDSVTEGTVPGRLLIWNMLTISLCDRDYAEGEKRLIEEAVRKLEVDEADFREMEHTLVAANAVEREIALVREKETGNEDAALQLQNLKERRQVIALNAREQMTGRR